MAPSLRGLSAEQADWGSVLRPYDTPSALRAPPSEREARLQIAPQGHFLAALRAPPSLPLPRNDNGGLWPVAKQLLPAGPPSVIARPHRGRGNPFSQYVSIKKPHPVGQCHTVKKICHSEPVRTLAWESPKFTGIATPVCGLVRDDMLTE